MDFAYDDRTLDYQRRLLAFMDESRLPGRGRLRRATGAACRASGDRRRSSPICRRRREKPGCGTSSCPASAAPD